MNTSLSIPAETRVGTRLLIVDDRADFVRVVQRDLCDQGYHVLTESSVEEALVTCAKHPFELVIVDLYLPELADGLRLIRALRERSHGGNVLAISATDRMDDAVAALKAGAADFLQKPFAPPRLFLTVEALLDRGRLRAENAELQAQARRRCGLIGQSPAMDAVWRAIERMARHDHALLIAGESGTGKDLVARAVHSLSGRCDKPLQILNCADRQSHLLDDDLFGHDRGAFTGAIEKRLGLFELAAGGTVFLDDIGDLPIHMQGQLLQVMETGEFRRLGGQSTHRSTARVIAATNRDLNELSRQGRFREDLLYRLNALQIDVPPLRDRGHDRALLAQHFLERERLDLGVEHLEFSPAALAEIDRMEFRRNNVRELRNLVIQLSANADAEVIASLGLTAAPVPSSAETLDAATQQFETEFIRARFAACGRQVGKTADSLGISRVQLWRKMNSLGLRSSDEPPDM